MASLSLGLTENLSYKEQQRPVIQLQDVQKSYVTASGDYPVLKGIDLSFQAGEFATIIGKSGSGKTTLLNMIAGIDRPTAGEVWVNGTALHELNENQLARWRSGNLGIVFQFFQLLPTLSVLENILLAMDFARKIPSDERKERALRLLDMVELSDHAYKLPTALSGGQQQRVAIARALANDPAVIIADEPTGNLDSKSADVVFELFNQLASQGKTIVIVTHDNSLAKRTHRTALIVDGEISNEPLTQPNHTLTTEQLILASQLARPVIFNPKELILRHNSNTEDFYIVSRGQVEIVMPGPNSSNPVITMIGPGQYFCTSQLFQGDESSTFVRASEIGSVEIYALNIENLRTLIDESHLECESLFSVASLHLAQNLSNREF